MDLMHPAPASPRSVVSFPLRPVATDPRRLPAVSGRPIQPSATPPAALLRILRTTADQLARTTNRAAAADVLREIADDLDPPADDVVATLIAAAPGTLA
jgi:hypothetical protein